jgi:hypothetical protein
LLASTATTYVYSKEQIDALQPADVREWIDALIEHDRPVTDDLETYEMVLLRCDKDNQFFAEVFLPESFDEPFTHQTDELNAGLNDDTIPKMVRCMWRGGGKSAHAKLYVVKGICLRKFRYVMWVSKSHDSSAVETENLKTEILQNPRIRKVFGYFKSKTYEGVDVSFSKKAWFACDPHTGKPICFIQPKGAEQQVRGANIRIFGRYQRPDLIICDDLEDRNNIDNEDIRKGVRRWCMGDLFNCVSRKRPDPKTNRWKRSRNPLWRPPWRIIYIDTLKHEDSMMAHILDSSEWDSARLPQSTLKEDPETGAKQYYSEVPEIISDEQVRAEARFAEENGTIDEYSREKMCLPVSPEHACWTRSMFIHYSDKDQEIQHDSNYHRMVIVDPAKTANQRSAYTAILASGFHYTTGNIYIRDLINEKLSPHMILVRTIEMALATNSRIIAVEVTGLSDWIKHQFEDYATKRGLSHVIQFHWLEGNKIPKGDFGTGRDAPKRARASMILPYYQQGKVLHENVITESALEQQMLSYPRPANWDALDCAGYIPKVLRDFGIFQHAPELKVGEQRDDFGYDEEYKKVGELIRAGGWRLN